MLPPLSSPQGIPLREAAHIPQRYFFPFLLKLSHNFWLPNPVPPPTLCLVGVLGLSACRLPLPACGDVLEVAAFNASSWWHEVDALGQDRAWVAERAALSTAGHSWAAEPSSEGTWLELDLGTRRNITGECRPADPIPVPTPP